MISESDRVLLKSETMWISRLIYDEGDPAGVETCFHLQQAGTFSLDEVETVRSECKAMGIPVEVIKMVRIDFGQESGVERIAA